MRRNGEGARLHTKIEGLAALLLLGVFAVCVLAVLLTGAGAYRRLVDRDQAAYARRTCAQYLTTRVRQADALDHVEIRSFGDGDALCLFEEGGYVSRVYCYDGWLMELYASEEADLAPEDGERLLETGDLRMSLENGLLELTVVSPDGEAETLYLSLRSGEEAGA